MIIKVMTMRVQYPNPQKPGAILEKTSIGPIAEYCPQYNSKQNIGSPITINMIKYGIKNAPENRAKFFYPNLYMYIFICVWKG